MTEPTPWQIATGYCARIRRALGIKDGRYFASHTEADAYRSAWSETLTAIGYALPHGWILGVWKADDDCFLVCINDRSDKKLATI